MSERQLLDLIDNAAISPAYRDVHSICSGRRIIVYGAGMGYDTLSVFVLQKFGYLPDLVLDKKFMAETTFKGVPACPPSPDHRRVTQSASDEKHLVIVSVGHRGLHQGILSDLQTLGYRNIIFAFDIYEYHLSHTPESVLQLGLQHYKTNRQKILAAFRLLADEMSRQTFLQILRIHLTRELHAIPSRPISEQYFPSDIHLSKGYARVINCGSYNGDTVRELVKKEGKIESLACFEPDEKNYAQLAAFVSSHSSAIADSIAAFPCGVFSKTTRLGFSGENSVNSTLDERGRETIQCVSLDDALPSFSPTFINMDVEGAEPDALAGAEKLIKRFSPDLAICVYHSTSHLWEIPLQVMNIGPGYRLYLRNHTGYPAETVLYATSGPVQTHLDARERAA